MNIFKMIQMYLEKYHSIADNKSMNGPQTGKKNWWYIKYFSNKKERKMAYVNLQTL